MLSLEAYIAKRKKEDHLNEFDLKAKLTNIRICTNYIFEYFNDYLDISDIDAKSILHNEKIEKFKKTLRDYSPEIQDWLTKIYTDYGNHLHTQVKFISKQYTYFYLYNTDAEFRSFSYDCYSELVKKLPYLKDKTEMLFLLIKDLHRVESLYSWGLTFPSVSEEFDNWVYNTQNKYGVNLIRFCAQHIHYFFDDEKRWPSTHKIKTTDSWRKYEYDHKQTFNLFNIDSLYRNMPKNAFTKGKKQFFEIILMYIWLHDIVGDDENYWEEYLKKINLP